MPDWNLVASFDQESNRLWSVLAKKGDGGVELEAFCDPGFIRNLLLRAQPMSAVSLARLDSPLQGRKLCQLAPAGYSDLFLPPHLILHCSAGGSEAGDLEALALEELYGWTEVNVFCGVDPSYDAGGPWEAFEILENLGLLGVDGHSPKSIFRQL